MVTQKQEYVDKQCQDLSHDELMEIFSWHPALNDLIEKPLWEAKKMDGNAFFNKLYDQALRDLGVHENDKINSILNFIDTHKLEIWSQHIN